MTEGGKQEPILQPAMRHIHCCNVPVTSQYGHDVHNDVMIGPSMPNKGNLAFISRLVLLSSVAKAFLPRSGAVSPSHVTEIRMNSQLVHRYKIVPLDQLIGLLRDDREPFEGETCKRGLLTSTTFPQPTLSPTSSPRLRTLRIQTSHRPSPAFLRSKPSANGERQDCHLSKASVPAGSSLADSVGSDPGRRMHGWDIEGGACV